VPKLGKLKKTKKGPQTKCASGSQRAVQPPGRPDVRIIICCPPSQWTKGKGRRKAKCKVSLRKHASKHYTLRK
jgi:hypothetical protein